LLHSSRRKPLWAFSELLCIAMSAVLLLMSSEVYLAQLFLWVQQ
jgi:hypothetical protein